MAAATGGCPLSTVESAKSAGSKKDIVRGWRTALTRRNKYPDIIILKKAGIVNDSLSENEAKIIKTFIPVPPVLCKKHKKALYSPEKALFAPPASAAHARLPRPRCAGRNMNPGE